MQIFKCEATQKVQSGCYFYLKYNTKYRLFKLKVRSNKTKISTLEAVVECVVIFVFGARNTKTNDAFRIRRT